MIRRFVSKIKAQENGFYRFLYRVAYGIRRLQVPVIPLLHSGLYWLTRALRASWRRTKNLLFSEPVFRSQCETCGSGFRLFDDMPNILGEVRIRLGNNVGIEGDATIAGGKMDSVSLLDIGDDNYFGYQTQFFIGPSIVVGSNVLVANRVTFVGYDSHPLDPVARAANEPPDESGSGPIVVEDYAWIGSNSIILKGVTIGRAAVVATGSVVTQDVAPFTVVAGNPARVVKSLEPVALESSE